MKNVVFHNPAHAHDDKALRFIVTARASNNAAWTSDPLRKDLLIIPHFQDRILPCQTVVDQVLMQHLSKQLAHDDFTGQRGDRRLYNLEQHGLGADMPRYVLVVGLGKKSDCDASIFCGLIGTIIEESAAAFVDRVIIPVHEIGRAGDIEHMASVLRCRTRAFVEFSKEFGLLKEIEIVCDALDEQSWITGLQDSGPLCGFCGDPSL